MGEQERTGGEQASSPVLAWKRRGDMARAALVTCAECILMSARVEWVDPESDDAECRRGWMLSVEASIRGYVMGHVAEWRGYPLPIAPIADGVPRADVVPDAVLLAAETWLREHVQGIAWPASEEQPAPQREPVAGWLDKGGNCYSLGDVEVFRYCDVWWYRVGARHRVGPHAGLRDAKLAAEDAAAEALRARVEALGYRMVRP